MANETTDPHTTESRSVSENLHDVVESSERLFEAGKQLTDKLNEVGKRVETATERGSEIVRSPWLVLALAVAISLAGWRILRSKS